MHSLHQRRRIDVAPRDAPSRLAASVNADPARIYFPLTPGAAAASFSPRH